MLALHFSYNSVVDDDGTTNDSHVAASPDYLCMIKSSEAPDHKFKIKTGAVCALMRNLSVPKGLVKNQCVLIESHSSCWIEVWFLETGNCPNVTHLIPCINLISNLLMQNTHFIENNFISDLHI